MKIMGKALLLALVTGGLTILLLFFMDNSFAQQAVTQMIKLPGGFETEEETASKENDTEKTVIGKIETEKNSTGSTGKTAAESGEEELSVETGRQQLVYQTRRNEAQTEGVRQQDGYSAGSSGQQAISAAEEQRNKSAASVDKQQENSTAPAGKQSGADTGSAVSKKKQHGKTEKESGKDKNTEGKQKKKYTYYTASQNYFSDAVFIGDSRTVGMAESGLLPNAVYYAKVGIGISGILTQRFISESGTMLTLEEALSRHSFGKVYIMIGINDMSAGDTEWFTEKYQELLDIVHRTQPEAVVFIQGNIPMGYHVQDMSGSLNNQNLRLRNEASGRLADNSGIFYLKTEELYADANGALNTYFSSDGLHVRPEYYPIWVDYLQHHAVLRE